MASLVWLYIYTAVSGLEHIVSRPPRRPQRVTTTLGHHKQMAKQMEQSAFTLENVLEKTLATSLRSEFVRVWALSTGLQSAANCEELLFLS